MRKPKMIIGITLIVQSITMFVLFLAFMNKNKKQLAGTFLTVGIIGGLTGAWILYLEYLENEKQRHMEKIDNCYECDGDDCDMCDEYEGFDMFDENNDEVNYSIQEETEEAPAEEQTENDAE